MRMIAQRLSLTKPKASMFNLGSRKKPPISISNRPKPNLCREKRPTKPMLIKIIGHEKMMRLQSGDSTPALNKKSNTPAVIINAPMSMLIRLDLNCFINKNFNLLCSKGLYYFTLMKYFFCQLSTFPDKQHFFPDKDSII